MVGSNKSYEKKQARGVIQRCGQRDFCERLVREGFSEEVICLQGPGGWGRVPGGDLVEDHSRKGREENQGSDSLLITHT